MVTLASLPAPVVEAWRASFLGEAPACVADRLLDGSSVVAVTAGEIVYRGLEHSASPFLALVVHGLLRVYMTSPQGRQVTIRYGSHGDVLGVPAVVAQGGPADVQALTRCELLRLSPQRFREVASADAATSWAVVRYLARLTFDNSSLLAENVFLTVRQRVARHLLDLAEREGGQLVVHASQQDIADAIGSVREVVSRVLKPLRDEGLIERRGATTVLADPAGLHVVSKTAHGAAAGHG
jgi:CRP-like cAMP-binding protein